MNGQKWMTDMEIRPWIKKYEPSNTLISWVMNNAWFVNYKAFQEGKIPFQYVIRPHEKFDVFETKKWGMALTQPLIVRPIGKNDKIFSSPIQIESFENVLITSLKKSRDGKGFVVRLFNPTNEQGLANFSFAQEKDIFECGPKDIKGSQIDSPISLDPWEVKTIWIE
jgi:alpha-mannosidase